MNWISVKDRFPTEYDKYYLVLSDKSCDSCNKNESHCHRLDFKRYRYDVARWSEKDIYLVEYYRAKGDHSWDNFANDQFTECHLLNNEITHWMPFNNEP